MTGLTRRTMVNLSIGAAVSGSTFPPGQADAADAIAHDTTGRSAVNIQRLGITAPTGDIPIISLATVHNNVVYLCGVTADPEHLGDVRNQTRQILERIDLLLSKAGSDRSRLLSAQVWLADMAHFAAHNAEWNAWVDGKNPPVRACVQAPQLWRPGMLVEIMVTAATSAA